MIANKKELAGIFGVTERTLTDWESAGMPIESRPGRGIASQYDTAKCIEWRTQKVLGAERQLSPRERKDEAQAKLYELQLLEKSGMFLLADDVEYMFESAITAARGELESSARKWKKAIDGKYGITTDLQFYQEQIHATLTRLTEGKHLEDDDFENVSQETVSDLESS